MARPQKQGMDYFPHDVDATNDEKIETLTALYGTAGYAFYFILLERIYRSPNGELRISDAETKQVLVKKCMATPDSFDKMLHTAARVGLFDPIQLKLGILTSDGIKSRMAVVVEKRRKMQEKYKKISESETQQETDEETRQSKVKESKEKESNDVLSLRGQKPVRESSCTQNELSSKDFILRTDFKEFALFVESVHALIRAENAPRQKNPFKWEPPMVSFESDIRGLMYRIKDDEKIKILTSALNVLHQRLNWPEYLLLAIKATIRASLKVKVESPYKFTYALLCKPYDLVSSATDGNLAAPIAKVVEMSRRHG